MKKEILEYAFVNALLTASYIALLMSFLFYVPKHFFPEEPNTVLVPIMMLMLFVFSAAVTSGLVLGRPLLWYLDGKKKEAVSLFISTLGFLFALIVTAFALFVMTTR